MKKKERSQERFVTGDREELETSVRKQSEAILEPKGSQLVPENKEPNIQLGGMRSKKNKPQRMNPQRLQNLRLNRPTSLKGTLQNYCLEELAFSNWQKKRLILIGEERLVERALSRIAQHNILALPVVKSEGSGIVGVIDAYDIVHALIETMERTQQQTRPMIRRDFMNKTVESLMQLKGKQKTYVISNGSSMFDAIQAMVHLKQERFLIVNRPFGRVEELTKAEDDADGFVTQADVIKFLADNTWWLSQEPLFQKTISELGLGLTLPITIHENTTTKAAFYELGQAHRAGAAIINDNGILLDNLSVYDLKGVTRFNAPILDTDVHSFLLRDQKRGWWHRPITIKREDTLYHVIMQFAATKVHRMYICNNGEPVGEISLFDIMNQLTKM